MNIIKTFTNNKYIIGLINFFKYAALICIVPPILNYAAINRELKEVGSHGLPYDVGGGQKLFLSCKGAGVPTIIMDSPIGMNSDLWLPVQEKLATITKVCVYDRAGLGLSERPFDPVTNNTDKMNKAKIQRGQEFTLERMVEDLRRLISSSSQQDRPLMFISAELGSMVARFYTQIYHSEVSHLVLINPLSESLFNVDDAIWKDFWYEKVVPKWYSYALGSAVGINRILLMANVIKPQMNSEKLGEEVLNRQKHLMCSPKHLFSLVDEFVNLNETLAQMKLIWTIKQFPQNVSVTILTSNTDSVFSLSGVLEENTVKSNKLKSAWSKSSDYLKNILHANSIKTEMPDSVYQQLYDNPNYLFNLVQDLIVKWRKNNVIQKNI